MKFGEIDINIKDYLGRIGPGITVALSIIYKTEVYEGMYWYTDEHFIIEIPVEIEEDLGKIEEYTEYNNIINHLKEVSADYLETVTSLEEIYDNIDQNNTVGGNNG